MAGVTAGQEGTVNKTTVTFAISHAKCPGSGTQLTIFVCVLLADMKQKHKKLDHCADLSVVRVMILPLSARLSLKMSVVAMNCFDHKRFQRDQRHFWRQPQRPIRDGHRQCVKPGGTLAGGSPGKWRLRRSFTWFVEIELQPSEATTSVAELQICRVFRKSWAASVLTCCG